MERKDITEHFEEMLINGSLEYDLDTKEIIDFKNILMQLVDNNTYLDIEAKLNHVLDKYGAEMYKYGFKDAIKLKNYINKKARE